MGVDHGKNLAFDFRLRQRRYDKLAFPGVVGLGLPVLDGAAAAGAEMLAEWFDALSAGLFDPDQLPPVRMMTRRGRHLDRLAAECVGNEEASSLHERDTITEMADMIDEKLFNHGARR
jgi:hypothetical protein